MKLSLSRSPSPSNRCSCRCSLFLQRSDPSVLSHVWKGRKDLVFLLFILGPKGKRKRKRKRDECSRNPAFLQAD